MASYTVRAGDTLNKVAVKYYGSAERWPEIVRSNPQLSARPLVADGSPAIYSGDVLIITEENAAGGAARETVSMDANARRDLGLVGNGSKFTGFTAYTLVRAVKGVDGFSFSTVWDAGNRAVRDAFRPFAYTTFDVYFDDDMMFKGRVMPPAFEIGPQAKELTAQGYPLCGVLLDSCLPPGLQPAEYAGLDLKQIAETVCEPFGIKVIVRGDVGEPFDKAMAEIGDKAWDFLEKLAAQRGLFLTNKMDGSLLIYKPDEEAVSATFVQGEMPFISCHASFDGQGLFSHITGYTKTTAAANSEFYMLENELLTRRGVLRCHAQTIEEVDDCTLEQSVLALAGQMYASCVKYKLTVSGHRDKNGRLYRPNMAVSVKAPGAAIYRETKLLADEVVLKRDDRTGETTEFTLVLPGSRDGKLPEEFPWEE